MAYDALIFLVLKSSGSAFENFHLCEYTTLVPVSDRIFSTAVATNYNFEKITKDLSIEKLDMLGKSYDFEAIAKNVRDATIQTFAEDESASVQARTCSPFILHHSKLILCVRGFTGHGVQDRRDGAERKSSNREHYV